MSTTRPSASANASSRSCEGEEEFTVVIGADGGLSFVHDDGLYELLSPAFPQLKTERASLVEPDGSGGWSVDLAPIWNRVNPDDKRETFILGSYRRRGDALAAEKVAVESILKGSRL